MKGKEMVGIIRFIFVVLLIISLFGIGLCDLVAQEWKTFLLGMLFALANIIIFVWK